MLASSRESAEVVRLIKENNKTVRCAHCGEESKWLHSNAPLPDNKEGGTFWFCSEKCYLDHSRGIQAEKKTNENPEVKDTTTNCSHFIIERFLQDDGTYKSTGRCLDCGIIVKINPRTGLIE